jgi:hypothetical protein
MGWEGKVVVVMGGEETTAREGDKELAVVVESWRCLGRRFLKRSREPMTKWKAERPETQSHQKEEQRSGGKGKRERAKGEREVSENQARCGTRSY